MRRPRLSKRQTDTIFWIFFILLAVALVTIGILIADEPHINAHFALQSALAARWI